MGLKSLPVLNKSGLSIYWLNIWDSIKLYKKYLHSYLFLHDLIYYFFIENLYYYYLNMNIKKLKKKNYSKSFNRLVKFNYKNKLKKLYIGKIVFLKYQSWDIIFINYFTTNKKYINYKNKFKFNKKKIISYFIYNKNNYNIFKNNYKYKF